MTTLLDPPILPPVPPACVSPRVLVDSAMGLGRGPAYRIARTRPGAELCDAIALPLTRDLLISRCTDIPDAHRVLGVALALGRAARTAQQHRGAYTAAAYAALAQDRRALGLLLLETALDADETPGDADPFTAALSTAIFYYEATGAQYRYFAARTALRLRHA